MQEFSCSGEPDNQATEEQSICGMDSMRLCLQIDLEQRETLQTDPNEPVLSIGHAKNRLSFGRILINLIGSARELFSNDAREMSEASRRLIPRSNPESRRRKWAFLVERFARLIDLRSTRRGAGVRAGAEAGAWRASEQVRNELGEPKKRGLCYMMS